MQTFFKIVPPELVQSHNDQKGETTLVNGSRVYWIHLDDADEQTLRGLEINSSLIDQAEEISEAMYLILDARVGRWDKAVVPENLLTPEWPRDKFGNPRVPNFNDILCNPDNQFHWIYKRFHPDSLARKPRYAWFHGETDPDLNDKNTIEEMLGRDPEWVSKYMKGEWGASKSAIHYIHPKSYLDYDPDVFRTIIAKSALYRSMDHGQTSPTCCLWWAVYKGVYICYREYYVPDKTISYHRQAISDLTGPNEHILISWADPSIFHKESQRNGQLRSVYDEYTDTSCGQTAPVIPWVPADNNEFGTRNQIQERLACVFKHPLTGESESPGVYFIKKSADYPYGCDHVIRQVSSQRKKLLGTDDGRDVYGDEREGSIEDHAYDPFRYFIGMRAMAAAHQMAPAPELSFENFDRVLRRKLQRTRPH